MFYTLFRYIYTILLILILPFVFLRLLWKSLKNPNYRYRLKERIGLVPNVPKEAQGGIWFHAVSVGESVAAITLIQALKKQFPSIPITLTTTTPTGSARVIQALGKTVYHCYLPYDLPWCLKPFLDNIKPKVCVLLETELWPNVLAVCNTRKIPVLIVNGRLSPRSLKGYARFGCLMRKLLSEIACVAAQTFLDGEHFVQLGLLSDRLQICGNVKFDGAIPPDLDEKAADLRKCLGVGRLIWVAASTHEGEETEILKAHQVICKTNPSVLLILVPRHPERFQHVQDLAIKAGFEVATRTEQKISPEICSEKTNVFIGDTMGELSLFYKVSDVAFVGGSLVPIGGHNVLEATCLGLPVIVGPHMHNFLEITKILSEVGALVKIETPALLANTVLLWLNDETARVEKGAKGLAVLEKNKGAVQKILTLVLQYYNGSMEK